MKRQEIEAKLIAKALDDEAFRQRLLADPRAAIEEATQIKVRGDVEVKVIEETSDQFYLVLPAAKTELSEEDLAAVAGGVAVYQSRRLKSWHSQSNSS